MYVCIYIYKNQVDQSKKAYCGQLFRACWLSSVQSSTIYSGLHAGIYTEGSVSFLSHCSCLYMYMYVHVQAYGVSIHLFIRLLCLVYLDLNTASRAAPVTQLVERSPRMWSVVDLNPTQGSFFFESCPECIHVSLPLLACHVPVINKTVP